MPELNNLSESPALHGGSTFAAENLAHRNSARLRVSACIELADFVGTHPSQRLQITHSTKRKW